jgi:hypothetical protein
VSRKISGAAGNRRRNHGRGTGGESKKPATGKAWLAPCSRAGGAETKRRPVKKIGAGGNLSRAWRSGTGNEKIKREHERNPGARREPWLDAILPPHRRPEPQAAARFARKKRTEKNSERDRKSGGAGRSPRSELRRHLRTEIHPANWRPPDEKLTQPRSRPKTVPASRTEIAQQEIYCSDPAQRKK